VYKREVTKERLQKKREGELAGFLISEGVGEAVCIFFAFTGFEALEVFFDEDLEGVFAVFVRLEGFKTDAVGFDPFAGEGGGNVDGDGVIDVIREDFLGGIVAGDDVMELLVSFVAKGETTSDAAFFCKLLDFELIEAKAQAIFKDTHLHWEKTPQR
jgi:hypothetical protein